MNFKIGFTKKDRVKNELTDLFTKFLDDEDDLFVRCVSFEQVNQDIKYDFQVIINKEIYNFVGTTDMQNWNEIALGIYSTWLLKNYKASLDNTVVNEIVGGKGFIKTTPSNNSKVVVGTENQNEEEIDYEVTE